MLKALLDTFRGHKAEQQLYDEFVEMLEMGWAVFEMVAEVLSGRRRPSEVEDDILVQDIAINRKERAIRRRLVEHVSLHSGGAVTSSLILMSVVKDAERIGDYCKNLLEVGQMMEVPARELRFYKDLMDVSTQVTQNFRTTLTAFSEADEDSARDIIEDETLINRRCDRLIEKIARSDLSAREAVTTVLWVRFLKRINAHLSNICSSLVLPVHRIDYRLSYDKEKSAAGRRKAAGEEPADEQ
jgi:phosphate uptake regulator